EQAVVQTSLLFQQAPAVPQRTILILFGTWLLINVFAWLKGLVDPTETARGFIETAICLGCIVGVGLWGRRLPSKFAWVVCGVIAVSVFLKTTQDFVPAWACHRSLLNQPKEVAELLRDGKTAVACFGQDSGSVPFSLDRSNARNFDYQSSGELRDFLGKHPRTLLIVAPELDLAIVRRLVPSGAEVVRVIEGRKARLILVQVAYHAGRKPGSLARRSGRQFFDAVPDCPGD